VSRLYAIRKASTKGTWKDDIPSSPDPTTYVGLPPVIDDFSCEDWTVYLQRNVASFGLVQAKQIMLVDFGHIGLFNTIMFQCDFNCSFVHQVNEIDPNYLGATSKLYCGAQDVLDSTVEATKSTADAVETLANNLVWIIPVGAGLVGAYYVTKAGGIIKSTQKLLK